MSTELLLLMPLAFIGGIISVISGGGLGIIMIVVFSAFFDIRTSVVMISLLGLAVSATKLWHFHPFIHWKLTKSYLLFGIPFSALGGMLLYKIPAEQVKMFIVAFCYAIVALRLLRPAFRWSQNQYSICVMSALTGLIGGAVGNSGLLVKSLLYSFGLTKETFIATGSAILLAMGVSKVATYMINFTWSPSIIQALSISILAVISGITVGKRLLPKVSKQLFEWLLLTIIFIGATRLLFQ